jgi:hypothetical protein
LLLSACGKTSALRDPSLIINGEDATLEDFPWQVALYRLKDKELLCGGSLLNARMILTGLSVPSVQFFFQHHLHPSSFQNFPTTNLFVFFTDFISDPKAFSKSMKLKQSSSVEGVGEGTHPPPLFFDLDL